MFITSKYAGYNRNGEQIAAGYFLLLMQPTFDSVAFPAYQNKCKCGLPREEHRAIVSIHQCPNHGIMARLKARVQAKQEPLDADFEEIVPLPDCPDCIRHAAEIDAQGCTNFSPVSNSYLIRALVRYTRLRQCGHWMMGTVRIEDHSLTVSGSYGGDGLPTSVPDELYSLGVDVPTELVDAWSNGGGWNGAGSEAGAMREWALKTFPRPKR